jgi:hypothetical protein
MNNMMYDALRYGTSLVHPSRQHWLIDPSLVDKKKKNTVEKYCILVHHWFKKGWTRETFSADYLAKA